MTNQVAQNILQQLGGNRFLAMTGARELVATPRGLNMRIGRNAYGVTHIRVNLTDADLYDLEFLGVRGLNITDKGAARGIYAENLRANFTAYTGLETSL